MHEFLRLTSESIRFLKYVFSLPIQCYYISDLLQSLFNDPIFYYPANNCLLGTYNFCVLRENNKMVRIEFLLLLKISHLTEVIRQPQKLNLRWTRKGAIRKAETKHSYAGVSLLRKYFAPLPISNCKNMATFPNQPKHTLF